MRSDPADLREMLAHPDRRFRMGAMRKLLEAPPPDLAATLLALTRDGYHGVRSVAAWALGRIGARDAAPRLTELTADPDPWVRKNACLSLARLGAREALPEILRLKRDPDKLVRGVAAWAERTLARAARGGA